MKLYELTDQFKGLQALMEDGELDATTLQDTLDGLNTDLKAKGQDVLLFLANLDGDIKAFDDEIKRMTARKKTLVSHHNWLKEYLRSNMIETGITEISCPVFTAKTGKPGKMVEITNESELPMEYQELVPASFKILKKKILDDLKAGVDVPGARLIDSKIPLRIR